MNKVFLFLSLFPALGFSQDKIFDPPLSPRIANYTMKAALLPDEKAVRAEYVLVWKNTTADTVRDLQFHLYLNAFKNNRTTFMKESGGRHRSGVSNRDQDGWGFIDIVSLTIPDGADLTGRIQYIQPDDGNPEDQTVIRVPLDKPVFPGSSVRILCTFYSKLPRVFARSGFTEDGFFMVGQWFPKIGVFENGKWNCHQYHSNSEFYADFGVYDLTITVPEGYAVAANGILTETQTDGGKTTYHFYQEDVIDAVWAASENYTRITDIVPVGKTARNVEVTYFLEKDKTSHAGAYRRIVPSMLQYAEEWISPYPYRNLCIVETPSGEGMTAGGMEYPTLFTTGQNIDIPGFELIGRVNWLELVTFHEFLHNYFQSMVASNEFEEPWLDEGFTSFMESRFLERYFREQNLAGDYGYILGAVINSVDFHRFAYLSGARSGVITQNAWANDNFYATASYSKPVLMLRTLQNYLGEDTMNLVIREYFKRWSFKHPRTHDFLSVLNEVSGKDMRWFTDQFLFSAKTVDYVASQITNNDETIKPYGWFGHRDEKKFSAGHAEPESADTAASERKYRSVVRVRNNGDAYFPVDILITFKNQDTVWRRWDGRDLYMEFHFHGASPVQSVHIDPYRKNLLDLNWANNSITIAPQSAGIWRYTTRLYFWIQSIFQKLSLFI